MLSSLNMNVPQKFICWESQGLFYKSIIYLKKICFPSGGFIVVHALVVIQWLKSFVSPRITFITQVWPWHRFMFNDKTTFSYEWQMPNKYCSCANKYNDLNRRGLSICKLPAKIVILWNCYVHYTLLLDKSLSYVSAWENETLED